MKVYQTRFAPMYHAFTVRKVTASRCGRPGGTGGGCQIIGLGADDAAGFRRGCMGVTKLDDDTVAIHPTAAELVTMCTSCLAVVSR